MLNGIKYYVSFISSYWNKKAKILRFKLTSVTSHYFAYAVISKTLISIDKFSLPLHHDIYSLPAVGVASI